MPYPVALLTWATFFLHTGVRLCVGVGSCMDLSEGEAYSIKGDAVITQLLPLHRGANCDKISMTEVQILEATKMAVQRVNELDLVPGVTLGLRVIDTCGEVDRSVKMALASLASDARSCQPTLSLGFLGPGDTASAMAVGRATRALHTPVVAYGPRTVAVSDTLDLIVPAPQRSAQAAVQVLGALNVVSISIVHTADSEGRTLAEHFSAAADDAYRCVEMVLEAGEGESALALLQEGPGAIVILGTRDKAQELARMIGGPGGPADLILLLDNAGPVPAAELNGVEVPLIILQRTAPEIPEFISFMERDFSAGDDPRREYIAAMSNCISCSSSELGYDASAPAAMASVLVYAEALREAQATNCGTVGGLCWGIKRLNYEEWQEKISQASLHAAASTAFPSLLEAGLDPGSDDFPRYAVKFMENGTFGNITQVGHADESSAILGQVDNLQPRCGVQCPCQTTSSVYYTTPMPEILPAPENITAPSRRPPSDFNIMRGVQWWSNDGWWPTKGLGNQMRFSKMEIATYVTAFTFIIVVLLTSSFICLYNLQKPPPRN